MMDLPTNPRAWLVVLGLSVVGIAIAYGGYGVGRHGKAAVRERFSSIDDERWAQVEGWYERWGSGLLLVSALPGLATVLAVGAGMFGIKPIPFLLWVSLSKLARNWLIVLLLYGGYQRSFA